MKKPLIIFLLMASLLTFLIACTQKTEEKSPLTSEPEKAHPQPIMTKETQVTQKSEKERKILIVYFSYSGNTRKVAESIHNKLANSDIYELKTIQTYPVNYRDCVDQAKREQERNIYPELQSYPDVSSYDTIFIGAPNWWGDYPMPVYSFINKVDLSSKTIIPFCTHGGSGGDIMFANIIEKIKATKYLNGLAIYDKNLDNTDKTVSDWLKELNIK